MPWIRKYKPAGTERTVFQEVARQVEHPHVALVRTFLVEAFIEAFAEHAAQETDKGRVLLRGKREVDIGHRTGGVRLDRQHRGFGREVEHAGVIFHRPRVDSAQARTDHAAIQVGIEFGGGIGQASDACVAGFDRRRNERLQQLHVVVGL
ncbi:hypothetical protein D3C80_1315430 [compost metagenome]